MNLAFFADLLREIRQLAPQLHIKGYTAVELEYMIRKAKMSYREGLAFLQEAGLDSLPGGVQRSLMKRLGQRSVEINATAIPGWRSTALLMSWACTAMPPFCMVT